MKTAFHYFNCFLVFLFGTLMFLSCGGNSQKTDELASAKEKADESFRNALRENLSDVATTNEIAEQEYERAKAEQEQLELQYTEPEREVDAAPYGYNQWGEPYANQDEKNLDKALDEYEKARQGYIDATYSSNPMDLMYYHQRMKQQIENCLFYAKRIGNRDIINKLKAIEREVDNLEF
jgi:hypothetical protein